MGGVDEPCTGGGAADGPPLTVWLGPPVGDGAVPARSFSVMPAEDEVLVGAMVDDVAGPVLTSALVVGVLDSLGAVSDSEEQAVNRVAVAAAAARAIVARCSVVMPRRVTRPSDDKRGPARRHRRVIRGGVSRSAR